MKTSRRKRARWLAPPPSAPQWRALVLLAVEWNCAVSGKCPTRRQVQSRGKVVVVLLRSWQQQPRVRRRPSLRASFRRRSATAAA